MNQQNQAVILARVSSKAQEIEGYSLESQEKLLSSYTAAKGLQLVRVFKIAESASKDQGRKVFRELVVFLKKTGTCHLVVEKTDRLTRNLQDAVTINDWLDANEHRHAHMVKESLDIHRDARSDAKFMWNVYIAVAKKYTDNLREEAMKGWAEKLAQGWLPAVPPPGYMTVTQSGKRVHVPNPETRVLIQKIFEFYLRPSETIKSTAEEMARLGIRTRQGRPYAKSKVQKMLNNPFYIGINRFNGKDYPGAQEAIIREDIFERVQQKMTRKLPTRYRKHNPVFKNLITCDACKGIVTWQLQKGVYYGTCQRSSDACKGRKLLRQDKIEGEITMKLKKLVSPSDEVIGWVANALQTKQKDTIEANEKLIASTQAMIARTKRMDTNLYDDKLAGDISQETYDQKHVKLQAELIELEATLSRMDQTMGLVLQQKLALLELSQKAADIYPKKTPEQKRTIITKLFARLTYSDGFVSVTYTNFSRAIAHNVEITNKILGGAI